MTRRDVLAIMGAWFACSVLAFGVTLNDLTAEFPRQCLSHTRFAMPWALLGGPLALGVAVITHSSAHYGLKWTCP